MRSLKLPTVSGAAAVLAAGLAVLGATPALARTGVEAATSHLGSYLAGRFARGLHDTNSAAAFYEQALQRDPKNDAIAEQAFMMEATQGNWPRAMTLARQLADGSSQSRIARLVLAISEFKAAKYEKAEEYFRAAGTGPIAELTSALARAWILSAQNDWDAALVLLDGPKQAEWAQGYLRYHRALIADLGGRRAEARASYERLFKQDSRTTRTALAYAHHAASSGDPKLARSILKEHADKSASGEGHPMVNALRDQIGTADKIPMLIEAPVDGLAEVFYGLGEALTGEGGIGIGAIYLQMALYLRPDFPFALAALANVHEATKHYEEAIAVYDRIRKDTPLQSSIEIRKAINLNLLERVDEAKALLEALAKRDPADIKPLDALGSIMRARKRYEEAVEYYSRAIALIPRPEKRHWTYWYSRGTCYERMKKWPPAEADLQRALQLNPEQPLVLNYLGYSWVDQNRNLKQGMSLIEKAVALKPDDGYIVDSLGWAHYKQSNFKEAVRYLERAVELRPEDPVLNDHLGDALWRVGRQREARFQWDQALTLKPEPEDEEKIRRKLQNGLPELAPPRALKKSREAQRPDQARKRVESKAGPGTTIPVPQ
jgi:tetratricopeptide (TPR) repeat protein